MATLMGMRMMSERTADTIRELLSHLVGQRLLEITENDKDEIAEGEDNFIELMFDGGDTVQFFIASDPSAYRGGSPIAFSDPDKESGELFEDGFFRPTPEEKEKVGWIAVQWHDSGGVEVHIVPVKGREHFLDKNCWCNPIKKVRDDDSWFWGHNEE